MIFRKKKYYFNPVSLTFEEIKINRKRRIYMTLSYVLISLVFTLASGYFLNQAFGSQESRLLEEQKNDLSLQMKSLMNKGEQIGTTIRNDLFVRDNTYRMILQLDTLPYSVRAAGTGGSAAAGMVERESDPTYQINEMIHSLTNQLQIQSGSLKMLYKKAMEYSAGTTHLPAILPVAKEDLIMISDDFGIRSDPFFFVNRVHEGLDFIAQAGKKVYATGDGFVTFIQHSRNGYGNEIVIDHKFGFGSRYAHLKTINVTEGEQVKRGQFIGTVGETGRATGPHLHYEVLYKNQPVNPSFYFDTSLTSEEFAQIIGKATQKTN